MKVVILDAAAADLDAAMAWIAADSPRAADALRDRIVRRVNQLAIPGFAHIGRHGRVHGTRELVVQPYIITYDVDHEADEVRVIAIQHGARDRDLPR